MVRLSLSPVSVSSLNVPLPSTSRLPDASKTNCESPVLRSILTLKSVLATSSSSSSAMLRPPLLSVLMPVFIEVMSVSVNKTLLLKVPVPVLVIAPDKIVPIFTRFLVDPCIT